MVYVIFHALIELDQVIQIDKKWKIKIDMVHHPLRRCIHEMENHKFKLICEKEINEGGTVL